MELAFNVQNRPAFEIPYSEISNTNLAGKNEVAVEFSLPAGGNETGTNGHLGGARSRGRKAGAAKDQLVEMRFYIPGTVTKKEKEKDEDGEEKSVDGSDVEEQNAASLFYGTLMDKAEIGEVAGDTFATFLDVLHLTPRFARNTSGSDGLGRLTSAQRTLRCRHVRKLVSIARQNLRLQDPIRPYQEVHASSKAGRHAYSNYDWLRSTSSTRSDTISFPGDAVQARRRGCY